MTPFLPYMLQSASTPEISLFDLLKQGGWAMYPLSLLSMGLFALILYIGMLTRAHNWWKPASSSQNLTSQFQRKWNGSGAVTEEAVWDHIEEAAILPRQLIQYLNVIASISPMVGLLGTVSGMIGAFQIIAEGGMGKPELLAGKIGEALITTAAGLVIAIPAMVSFFVFRHRLEQCERKTADNLLNNLPEMSEQDSS